jgi:hypothetical protein
MTILRYHEGYEIDISFPSSNAPLPCISRTDSVLPGGGGCFVLALLAMMILGLIALMTILDFLAVMMLHIIHPHAEIVLVGGDLSPRVVMVLRYVQGEAIPSRGYVAKGDLLLGPARRAAVTRLRPANHAPTLYRLSGIVAFALLRRD